MDAIPDDRAGNNQSGILYRESEKIFADWFIALMVCLLPAAGGACPLI
jgi:hypothetical protein